MLKKVPDVVVLVDGDNSANVLKHVQQFVRPSTEACTRSAHVFVSRSVCPVFCRESSSALRVIRNKTW